MKKIMQNIYFYFIYIIAMSLYASFLSHAKCLLTGRAHVSSLNRITIAE